MQHCLQHCSVDFWIAFGCFFGCDLVFRVQILKKNNRKNWKKMLYLECCCDRGELNNFWASKSRWSCWSWSCCWIWTWNAALWDKSLPLRSRFKRELEKFRGNRGQRKCLGQFLPEPKAGWWRGGLGLRRMRHPGARSLQFGAELAPERPSYAAGVLKRYCISGEVKLQILDLRFEAAYG